MEINISYWENLSRRNIFKYHIAKYIYHLMKQKQDYVSFTLLEKGNCEDTERDLRGRNSNNNGI